jgi:uncharacterized membrane protein
MAENTITDSTYGLVEVLEKRMKWMLVVIIACFIISPVALGLDGFFYLVISHEKGGFAGINMSVIATIAAVSLVVMAFGMKNYVKIKKWERQLDELEQLEKTICREVLGSEMN